MVRVKRVQRRPAEPARLDLRDHLDAWFWRDGPGFEVWGGSLLRHVPREWWQEFDPQWIYRVNGDGSWEKSRPIVIERSE